MDPTTRGSEQYGHEGGPDSGGRISGPDNDGAAFFGDAAEPPGPAGPEAGDLVAAAFGERRGPVTAPRPPRDPLAADFGTPSPSLARTVQLVAGDFLLTVNPVDGSEIELCPPIERPSHPVRYVPAERAAIEQAGRAPVPPGPTPPVLPLLERQDERERLAQHLARGRSVRLVGQSGAGRSTLLDAVAEDCRGLAPDGVVRLSGYKRSSDELLHDLFAAVYRAPLHRPDHSGLLALVREIGAVVVVDDLEFGGAGLDALLAATPECAFVFAVTPDVPAPSAGSHLEEVLLPGLGRAGGLELLEAAVARPLTDDEASWAGDLWFESEGLPLRFVQAGALLRQRDRLRAGPAAAAAAAFDTDREYGVFDGVPLAPAEDLAEVPLPTLAQGAAPAALLASRLNESAREALRFAVALGGEMPHQAHLPALTGDTHADAALGELAACGLVTPVGSHYRLAAGVYAQLAAAGYADDVEGAAHVAAQHFAWWAGHPSVGPERAAAESDALLAALGVLVAGQDSAHAGAAVLLARSAAPAFAGALHWSAWERALRMGQEAARISGEVAEEAYFHHELGILSLCEGRYDRARVELEASIALRGALAEKRGAVAGRRALALIEDRTGSAANTAALAPVRAPAAFVRTGDAPSAGEEISDARYDESASPPGGVPAAILAGGYRPDSHDTGLVTRQHVPDGRGGAGKRGGVRRSVLTGARRNVVAAGAGALLAAVLGTVVTLGAAGNPDGGQSSNGVDSNATADEGGGAGGLDADRPAGDGVVGGDGSGGAGDGGRVPGDTGVPPGQGLDPDDPDATLDPDDDLPGVDDPEATPSGSVKPTGKPTKPSGKPTTATPDPDPEPSDPDPEPSDPDPEPSDPDPEPSDPGPGPSDPDPEPEPSDSEPPPPDSTDSAGGSAPAVPTLSSSPAVEPGGAGEGITLTATLI